MKVRLLLRLTVILLMTQSLSVDAQSLPSGAQQSAEPIRYTVSFPEPHTHYMEVSAIVPTGGRAAVELMMAVWTPGSYLVREYSRHVEDVRQRHVVSLSRCAPESAFDRLCELNVIEQAVHVCQTTVVETAWQSGQQLAVHALIFGLHDGRLRELGFSVSKPLDVVPAYQAALAAIT